MKFFYIYLFFFAKFVGNLSLCIFLSKRFNYKSLQVHNFQILYQWQDEKKDFFKTLSSEYTCTITALYICYTSCLLLTKQQSY